VFRSAGAIRLLRQAALGRRSGLQSDGSDWYSLTLPNNVDHTAVLIFSTFVHGSGARPEDPGQRGQDVNPAEHPGCPVGTRFVKIALVTFNYILGMTGLFGPVTEWRQLDANGSLGEKTPSSSFVYLR